MYRLIYKFHGIEYRKWIDKKNNYIKFTIIYDGQVYMFDTIKEVHKFIIERTV